MSDSQRTTAASSRSRLIQMARHNMALVKAGELDQCDSVLRVPASVYLDQVRFDAEINQVFRRMPLMLALTCEVRNAGDFKTIEAAGVPVLIVRGEDGVVRAFVNSCSHRGAQIALDPSGTKRRFSCPYHAWTYDTRGALVSIYSEQDFGEIDKSCHGLTELPVAERSGLVWVTLDPDSSLDTETFLCGYDHLLAHFGFEDWELFESRTVYGPNWKIAYDGYMDLYHLPILHKNTFGSNMPNQALYDAWGPHQRVSSPNPGLLELENRPEVEWPVDALMQSVWTIFPHISIASFDGGGGRGVMISQLFPGDTPLESRTVQNYVMAKLPPSEEMKQSAQDQFKLLEYVVQEEDYATGLRQQRALMSRPGAEVLFGRNEGGGQHFHGFLDTLLETADEDLQALFESLAA